jgi:DNA invertase Pin-like site-specific DNA recombinase
MERGVDFIACDNPHATKLTIHILAAVAQHEREMISQRTKDALAAAKARGKVLGGPKLREAQQISLRQRQAQADQRARNIVPIIKDCQRAGLTTFRAIAEALNNRGVATARGGAWHASTVRDALRRVTT